MIGQVECIAVAGPVRVMVGEKALLAGVSDRYSRFQQRTGVAATAAGRSSFLRSSGSPASLGSTLSPVNTSHSSTGRSSGLISTSEVNTF